MNTYANIKNFGAQGNGVADDTLPIAAAIALAAKTSGAVYCPPGVYVFPQKIPDISNAIGVKLFGAGQGITVFRSTVPAGTPAFGDAVFMNFITCNDIHVHDITFDINGILTTNTNTDALGFIGCNRVKVHDAGVINGTRNGIAFNGGSDLSAVDCLLTKAGAAVNSFQNEAIIVSVGGGAVNTVRVRGNTITGWGTLFSGNDVHVIDNNVSGWGYGAGITINADTSTSRPVIVGNTCKDSTGLDVNNTQPSGIECWSPYATITGNTCENNAGAGIAVGGQSSTVTGNTCVNNGNYNRTGAGIAIVGQAGWTPVQNSLICNNVLEDTGPGTQAYGIQETPGVAFSNNRYEGNMFAGNTVARTSFSTASTQIQYQGDVFEATASATLPLIGNGGSYSTVVTVAGANLLRVS